MGKQKKMIAFGLLAEDCLKVSKTPIESRMPSQCGRYIEVEIPEINEDEVLVKVVSSGLNYNSLWSVLCRPVDPFSLINGHVRRNPCAKDHLQDYAIIGSDAAGYIVQVGKNVKKWQEGDEVIIHCNVVDQQHKIYDGDDMTSISQSIWGYETNFGAFAEYTKVKASQLIARPESMSWDDAGAFCLTLSTAYRMLYSQFGADLKEGETCLIWGAAGGLGSYAIQLVRNKGGIPICVVSNKEKFDFCKTMGCEYVYDRSQLDKGFVDSQGFPDYLAWRYFKRKLKKLGCPDIDVVFEHVGRDTLALSIYLLRKGGRVVTCAATSGHQCVIDLRYLWMEVKKLIGSHFANYREAREATSLLELKSIQSSRFRQFAFSEIPEAMDCMFTGKIIGNIGISGVGSKN